MLAFNQRVFEGHISGTTDYYTDTRFADLLGRVERLTFAGKMLGVTGTNPTLTIQVEHSADLLRWRTEQATPELNALALSANTSFNFDSGTPPLAISNYIRLRITLGGTSPTGTLQLYASGF